MEHRTPKLSKCICAHIERVNSTVQSENGYSDQASRLAELGSLSALLAHEINGLMTHAQAYTQFAIREQGASSDPSRRILTQLESVIKRTALLTESMMRYADPTEPESKNAPACRIEDAHAIAYSFVDPISESADQIRFAFTCNTQDALAQIEPISLEQVLINLYMNAEQAIRRSFEPGEVVSGDIMINASRECSTWNTPLLRITVQDSGAGISAYDLQSVFEPWNQGNARGQRRAQDPKYTMSPGHGLGLAVCDKLITNAGGTISCESTEGIGTTFTILLPVAGEESANNTPLTRAA